MSDDYAGGFSRYKVSEHARQEMKERQISTGLLQEVLTRPGQTEQVLERHNMKVRYDQDVDALTIILKQDVPVDESDEQKPGVVLDYDSHGELISIEILDASRHVPDVTTMEYQLTPHSPKRSA